MFFILSNMIERNSGRIFEHSSMNNKLMITDVETWQFLEIVEDG